MAQHKWKTLWVPDLLLPIKPGLKLNKWVRCAGCGRVARPAGRGKRLDLEYWGIDKDCRLEIMNRIVEE